MASSNFILEPLKLICKSFNANELFLALKLFYFYIFDRNILIFPHKKLLIVVEMYKDFRPTLALLNLLLIFQSYRNF